jgi:hypothetical protein
MDYQQVAESVMQEACMRPDWGVRDLAIWLRDGCRCVYCGKDMLESYDAVFYGGSLDHLLPKGEYREIEDVDWNRVLSCRACNTIKNIFDPNKTGDLYLKGTKSISDSARYALIDRVKAFIDEKRLPKDRFHQQRDLILKALRTSGLSASAASA